MEGTREGTSNETSKIRPLADRVVVKPIHQEEITPSGIVIPDTAKEKPQEGTVIAVGSGKRTEMGERVPMDVHEGDRVLFAKYGGTELVIEGEDVLVLRESDVLAVITRSAEGAQSPQSPQTTMG